MAQKNTEHFATVIRESFAMLGITQADFRAKGGPSDTTLRGIMSGKPVSIRSQTLKSIDAGFGWPQGTAASILAGKDAHVSSAKDEVGQGDHSARFNSTLLLHELTLLWETWRDITLDLMQGTNVEMARRARRALILTSDVVNDVAMLGRQGAERDSLISDTRRIGELLIPPWSTSPDDPQPGPTDAEVDAAAGLAEMEVDDRINGAEQA